MGIGSRRLKNQSNEILKRLKLLLQVQIVMVVAETFRRKITVEGVGSVLSLDDAGKYCFLEEFSPNLLGLALPPLRLENMFLEIAEICTRVKMAGEVEAVTDGLLDAEMIDRGVATDERRMIALDRDRQSQTAIGIGAEDDRILDLPPQIDHALCPIEEIEPDRPRDRRPPLAPHAVLVPMNADEDEDQVPPVAIVAVEAAHPLIHPSRNLLFEVGIVAPRLRRSEKIEINLKLTAFFLITVTSSPSSSKLHQFLHHRLAVSIVEELGVEDGVADDDRFQWT